METKSLATAHLDSGAVEGSLIAQFSHLNTVDRDGDIIMPGAIPSGVEVPLVWSHDWSKIVGKGVTQVDGQRATFKGAFFMDTTAGAEAYRTVKALGSLQEYSWGFLVKDSEWSKRDGQPVRLIKDVELLEVSPVLIGAAGRGRTGTVAIKSTPHDVERLFLDFLLIEARANGVFDTQAQPSVDVALARRNGVRI